MGAIGECCCCRIPGCESSYELPIGNRAAAFSLSGVTHPLTSSPTLNFAQTITPSSCCSTALATLNQVVTGDLFTNSYDMEDLAETEDYECCPPTARLNKQATTEIRASGRAATQAAVRYCDLNISVCVATRTLYGVATCGIEVQATLGFKLSTASDFNFFYAGRMQGTFSLRAGCSGPTTDGTYNTWANCDGTAITAWPATPTMPTLSLPATNCSLGTTCTLNRSVFLPGITSLPAGTVIVFPAGLAILTGACSGVLLFQPCIVQSGYWTPDDDDACGIPGFFPDTNFGSVCEGSASSCASVLAFRKLISRTRTQSQTMSHAVGTKIFDVYSGAWSLTL